LDLEPLTQSVLSEALRNVSKHAAATAIDVGVSRDEDIFKLEVHNDGVSQSPRGPGIGLRLAAFEALQHGGMVEFGPAPQAGWRVRLVVPLRRDSARETH
jgi:signal transduction histidine kinase